MDSLFYLNRSSLIQREHIYDIMVLCAGYIFIHASMSNLNKIVNVPPNAAFHITVDMHSILEELWVYGELFLGQIRTENITVYNREQTFETYFFEYP